MAEVKTGYMHKCGKSVRSWKRRWFVLKPNGYLYYYESSSAKHDKGKIDVIDADRVAPWQQVSTAERKLPSGFSVDNAFAIVTRERTFTCVCENDGDSVAWMNAIQKVREGAGNGGGGEQQYPPPTFPKEEPVAVKREAPLTSASPKKPPPEKPPPYSPASTAAPPPPASVARMPNPLDYGGSLPYQQPTPQGYNASTLPKPQAPPQSQVPPQGYNSLPRPTQAQQQQRSASFTAPPPGGPGYAGGYPPGNYQPPPQPPAAAYAPRPPPQAQYQPPGYQQQQPYASQPQYRPPPQPQYRPPPQQYRPPPQPQYRPPPPQQQYRPPQPQYRPPPRPAYQSYAQPPRARVVQQPVQKTTTVTVVTIPAATQQYVIRR